MRNWINVNEKNVQGTWKCMTEGCEDPQEADAGLAFLAESGTPLCSGCDREMVLVNAQYRPNKANMVVSLDGGLVSDVMCDDPVVKEALDNKITVIDADIDGAGEDEVSTVVPRPGTPIEGQPVQEVFAIEKEIDELWIDIEFAEETE